jgi:hypothetical protein
VGSDPDDEDAPIPGLHHYVASSLNFGTTLRLRNAESNEPRPLRLCNGQ